MTLIGGGEDLLPALAEDSSSYVRAQAAEWAADHPSPEATHSLLRMLEDPSSLCRFTAKDSLIRIGRPAAEALAAHLSTASGPSLSAGLEVAAGLPDASYLRGALDHCRHDDAHVRALAAAMLGALGGEPGVAALITLLDDPVATVRAEAARALGKLGHWPAAAALTVLLSDRSYAVRQQAALALGQLGPPGVLFLRRALSHHDRFASDVARQVIDLAALAENDRAL